MAKQFMQSNLPRPEQAEFVLRDATKADLDGITRVHIEGFEGEPLVRYCYPLRHQFPQDFRHWTLKEYEEYLDQPQKYVVHVLQNPDDSNSNSDVAIRIVGVAVWNISVTTKSIEGTCVCAGATITFCAMLLLRDHADPGLDSRKDANKAHCEAFDTGLERRFKTYFPFGDKQLYLSALVVHPSFRRRGAGTVLVNWGIQVAEGRGWPVTVAASPTGKFLYTHLRFQVIEVEVIRVNGEEETLETTIMVRDLKSVPESGSGRKGLR